ncbi:MAG: ribose 5-phosphate isomerase A [Rhodospirillaceae bacterium]|nr:MAG: ribose 5-phosphate isomerase A [Rhodospirillaceae bacterium]
MRNREKKVAGEAAAALVEEGMTLGLGTGSTVAFFLDALGERVRGGMNVRGVPTSEQTAAVCHARGIALLDIHSVDRLDLTIDGADEIDPRFRMIKGGGGALLREKIVAEISERVVIVVDSAKVVEWLGAFPVPVEVVRFGCQHVQRHLAGMGIAAKLRSNGDAPYTTDNGHYILDCAMGLLDEPEGLAARVKAMTGVVECGLFMNHCHTLIIGTETGAIVRTK